MKKLDRLGWVAGFSFTAYGVRVGVRTNQPDILEELNKRLPYGWKQARNHFVETLVSLKIGNTNKQFNTRQFHLLYGGIVQLARSLDIEEVLDIFESTLNLHIAEYASNRVFVHAGAVNWKGRTIVIPGRTHAGKSTLVRELVKAGATYYSDEYAVLDMQGRVHPYPVPIGVRNNPQARQEKYPIETFGGIVGTKPLPVDLVLLTEYKAGTRWRPKQIPAGQGLLSILANTVSAQRNPAKALATLQQVVLKAPVLKGVRGETGEVVDALLNRPWPTL
ncbi:MAG: hypothetical protein HYR56_06755 [Acidobacteria bacterium]|nr:hypothetical protein [Acidobacteriota bacterium]MBI3426788.1 hypothetical protein [Acidobacteriota bacterium]